MPKEKSKIFRIKVPPDDPVVREWCTNQHHNLSLAVRQLILDEAKKHGVGNYFATNDERITGMPNAKPKKTIKRTEPAESASQVQQPAINNQAGFDSNMQQPAINNQAGFDSNIQQPAAAYPTGYQSRQDYQPSQPSQNTRPTNPARPSGNSNSSNSSDDDLNDFMMQ